MAASAVPWNQIKGLMLCIVTSQLYDYGFYHQHT
jgi:hypothetical protein